MKPTTATLPPTAGWQPVVFAKDQPEYQPLPVLRNADGDLISAWQLSWRERIRLFLTGRLYIGLLTFNRPLQPILPMAAPPTLAAGGGWTEGKK